MSNYLGAKPKKDWKASHGPGIGEQILRRYFRDRGESIHRKMISERDSRHPANDDKWFIAGSKFAANNNSEEDLAFLHDTYNKLTSGIITDEDCSTNLKKLLEMFEGIYDSSLNFDLNQLKKEDLIKFMDWIKKYLDFDLGHPTEKQIRNSSFYDGMNAFLRKIDIAYDIGYSAAKKGHRLEDTIARLDFNKEDDDRVRAKIIDSCEEGYNSYSFQINYINGLSGKVNDDVPYDEAYEYGRMEAPPDNIPITRGQLFFDIGFRYSDLPKDDHDYDALKQEYTCAVMGHLESYYLGFSHALAGNLECDLQPDDAKYDDYFTGFSDARLLSKKFPKLKNSSVESIRYFSYGLMSSYIGDDDMSYLGTNITNNSNFKKGRSIYTTSLIGLKANSK